MSLTIKDIAQMAGVGTGTVSRVINDRPGVSDITRAHISKIIEQQGYAVNDNAKNLKLTATNNIAVIVKGARNMFFAAILEELQNIISARGYFVLIHYMSEPENEVISALRLIREKKPLGIIFLGGNTENFERSFAEIKLPCVLCSGSTGNLTYKNLSNISIDDAACAEQAMNYLLKCGHRKIAILSGRREVSHSSRMRLDGCAKALALYGIDIAKIPISQSNYSMEGGYHAAKRILKTAADITALFAMADVMAIGAINALFEAGKSVPKDVSVMGIDGIEMSRFVTPSLTTMKQPDRLIAATSAGALIDMIERGSQAVHKFLPVELIAGQTVVKII